LVGDSTSEQPIASGEQGKVQRCQLYNNRVLIENKSLDCCRVLSPMVE
jgi:hypothetical protein